MVQILRLYYIIVRNTVPQYILYFSFFLNISGAILHMYCNDCSIAFTINILQLFYNYELYNLFAFELNCGSVLPFVHLRVTTACSK